ncbi:DEAD-box ATP-dependent RNA helicase 14-like [Typha latifolia]|uniref:DEAD-box ATP-dependent RNA helicase 14-like n=1 Tax=Typha latifolia TaxID=4733 RepID=UPI003C30CD31
MGGGAAPRYAPEDPTLPKPWRGLVDGTTGYLYYWNPETNVTQYERPQEELPPPPPPPLLPPPPPRLPSKSASVIGSSSTSAAVSADQHRHHHHHHHHRRDSNDDDTRYHRRVSKDSHDLRTTSARGHGLSSVAGAVSSVEAYRHQHEIIITGDNVPAPFTTFESTGFPAEILKEVHHAGFSYPTPIQAQSWPIALQSRDIVAIAKTGSGKTLGYLIPGFVHLKRLRNNSKMGPTVLVLAPTRELATQIQDEAVKFGRSSRISCTCLYGGAPKGPQLRDLDRGVDVVVATPGRLNDILEMRRINLRQVSYLVLDEADRMLDMGFEPQIRKIVKEIPHRRQTLMFTATWPKEVRRIAADLLVHAIQVNIGRIDELVANNAITQYVEVITPLEKLRRLEQILRSQDPGSKVIIFCSTKRMCDQLARTLTRQFGAAAIHGDKSQVERDRVLGHFRTGRSPILVATDVAARGLDIKDIRVVINYDFPTGVEDYVHRIGRTGRAGATGVSYTFFCDQDSKYAADLVKVLEGANQRVPQELRVMVSRGGYGGKSRRWGPRSSVREGDRTHTGRNDLSHSGRGVRGLAPSGRSESGHGYNDHEPHGRYNRGYQDGHEPDVHDHKPIGKGRSRSRSRSGSHRYSPSPKRLHVGGHHSRSRSRSRSWNYDQRPSRSRSHSASRDFDQLVAGSRLVQQESPLSDKGTSPTIPRTGDPVLLIPSFDQKEKSPSHDAENVVKIDLDHFPSLQKEGSGSPCNYVNGKAGASNSPERWLEGSSGSQGHFERTRERPVIPASMHCNKDREEEEEGMIPGDEDGEILPEDGMKLPTLLASQRTDPLN